ncbi:MAG: hypothetical protein ACJAS1_005253 [Oleiphilaceae bacterium]|jgi:hypothetical protein
MYVTTKKLSEMTGYTREAINNKTKKGVWQRNVHYYKAPDGRLMMNLEAIFQWIEGK